MNASTPAIKARIATDEILAHGWRLAADGYAEPSLSAAVWCLIVEAVQTWRALPDRERKWLSTDIRSAWPEPEPPSYWERFEMDLDRIASGMQTDDTLRPRQPIPSPAAIDRAEVVMRWLRSVQTKNTRRDLRLLVDLAAGVPVRRLRMRYHPISRQAIYQRRDHLVWQIVGAVSIAADDGGSAHGTGR